MKERNSSFMKVAVTYDNGEIFQHFGHTEEFKVYEVENKKILNSEVVNTNGEGHGALASFLFEGGVDVLICGGIGQGAVNALAEAGIEVCSGITGDADKAVNAYIEGELESSGVTCNHHEEGHNCSDHEEGGCHGSCHGCHAQKMEGRNVGKPVKVHYQGTFDNGEQFDSSYDRGEPLEFICGAGMMIKGFDKAVADMQVGDIVNIHLMPEEAYGEKDPNAIFTVEIAMVPGAEELSEGQQVILTNPLGQPFRVTVLSMDDKNITFDANHEMAGKELNFKIELVEVIE